MLQYKDFVTGKIRHTFAEPVGVRCDGLLGVEGLLLRQKRTGNEVWIPRYLLYGGSVAQFNELKRKGIGS